MAKYLDLEGLSHFKEKQDISNDDRYLKKTDLDDTINEKLINVYRYKGSKPSFEDLPKEGNSPGDVWDVAGGMNYAWDGSKWDALGSSKVDIVVDSEINAESENPVQNRVIHAALASKANVDDANKVMQTPTTSNSEYPILTKNTTDTDTVSDTSRFAAGVTINPSNGAISATTFKGDLDGTASMATNSSYATKAGTADLATKAESATIAESAIRATTADSATSAITAGTATKASTADDLSKTLAITNGGTGATSADDAWIALGGGDVGKLNTGSSTDTFLRNDGTWGTPENTVYSSITNPEIDTLFE